MSTNILERLGIKPPRDENNGEAPRVKLSMPDSEPWREGLIESGVEEFLGSPERWPNRWDKVYEREGVPHDLQHPYFGFDYIQGRILSSGAENVLDIAMGPGRHTIPLAEEGLKVYGFDLSPKALELARGQMSSRGLSGELVLADMFSTYPYPSSFFDSVIAIQAIYHGYPPHMKAAMSEIHRVLRPGGVFAFTVSMDLGRAMLGAKELKYKKVSKFKNTYIPKAGREKDIPHYYPDEGELEAMLRPDFNELEMFVDMDHKYRLITCVSNQ